jgi:hypothetical protein
MVLLRTLAILLTALILVPSGAHLFELPGRIGLGRDAYLAVQQIYAGWAMWGVPIVAALVANLALAAALWRRERGAAVAALLAAALIAASLGVFFGWTFPANRATANWTVMPADWEALRRQWEWSHAANAVVVLAALVATTVAGVARRDNAARLGGDARRPDAPGPSGPVR